MCLFETHACVYARTQECSSNLLELEFRKGHSLLKGDETQYTGCVVCDDMLREKCEVRAAVDSGAVSCLAQSFERIAVSSAA